MWNMENFISNFEHGVASNLSMQGRK
ncbi:hypothetical protein NC653_030295 [Populus alba x Populus x berolinensis]|uniref:Uncharacterized protein n=1 Tax=Populus alba x Populus x berolinensis TaxID=444605 RepID=A0AAD6LW00_9ROSI|nr:hypothetical protein NC653_030295 [Populus alba x Populus x berolinensis]